MKTKMKMTRKTSHGIPMVCRSRNPSGLVATAVAVVIRLF